MTYFDFLSDEAVFKLCADRTLLYARADNNDATFTVMVADVHEFCGILLCEDNTYFQKNHTTGQINWT